MTKTKIFPRWVWLEPVRDHELTDCCMEILAKPRTNDNSAAKRRAALSVVDRQTRTNDAVTGEQLDSCSGFRTSARANRLFGGQVCGRFSDQPVTEHLMLNHSAGKRLMGLLVTSFAKSIIYSLSVKPILTSIKSILLRPTLHEIDEQRGIVISSVGCC